MLNEVDTQEQIGIKIAVPETKGLAAERIILKLGTIDQIEADALVCPQDGTFKGDSSIEKGLLRGKYGAEPFDEAEKIARTALQEMNAIGERRNKLPVGYARPVDVEENEQGVRQIIHTNWEPDAKESLEEAIAKGVSNALREASLYPEKGMRSVAIPLPSGMEIKKGIGAVYAGMRDHFDATPDSAVERVILVINADDVHREQIERDFASIINSN